MERKTAEEYLTDELIDKLQTETDDNNGVIDAESIIRLMEDYATSRTPVIRTSNKDIKTITIGDPWISVKDELPKEYGQYLIYCPQSFPKNCRFLSANFYDDNQKFYSDANESVHDDVTHWMTIPEPKKNK
jgi:hypothetical protein